jgi:thiol-disulfide isomerase/thioredoxin
MNPKMLITLFFTSVSVLAYGQKKKTEILDTLGNKADFITFMSIQNTGKYKWYYDKSNDQIRYIKWKRYNQTEIDSVLSLTEKRNLLPERIGTEFKYSEWKDLNGNVYNPEYLKGKILVINFWFVGCGPCEIEMPELNELVNQYKDNKEVLFLSFSRSSASKTKHFLNRKAFKYQTIIMDESLRNEFKISSYPTNYVIHKDGTYQFVSKGISAGAITLMNRKIQELIQR